LDVERIRLRTTMCGIFLVEVQQSTAFRKLQKLVSKFLLAEKLGAAFP
jgi:hypothetical protein